MPLCLFVAVARCRVVVVAERCRYALQCLRCSRCVAGYLQLLIYLRLFALRYLQWCRCYVTLPVVTLVLPCCCYHAVAVTWCRWCDCTLYAGAVVAVPLFPIAVYRCCCYPVMLICRCELRYTVLDFIRVYDGYCVVAFVIAVVACYVVRLLPLRLELRCAVGLCGCVALLLIVARFLRYVAIAVTPLLVLLRRLPSFVPLLLPLRLLPLLFAVTFGAFRSLF